MTMFGKITIRSNLINNNMNFDLVKDGKVVAVDRRGVFTPLYENRTTFICVECGKEREVCHCGCQTAECYIKARVTDNTVDLGFISIDFS